MATQTKSWRDVIKVHPAADLFPMMSADELKALGEDIKENGLQTEIAVWRAASGRRWFLVDGRNRLDAAELVGLPVQFIKKDGDVTVRIGAHLNRVDDLTSLDPYAYVVSANIHRRHLTAEQKRELIAKLVKATPEKSDRQIAEQSKASPSTVAKMRKALEQAGDVSKLDTRTDAKGRKQQAHKPVTEKRRNPEDYIAEAKAPATKEPTAEQAIRKLRDQIDAAVALAVRNTLMQPIIDTIFDIAATRAERNGNVRLFVQQVRQRIDAMEFKLSQMMGTPEPVASMIGE
jgi:hypothetical protein